MNYFEKYLKYNNKNLKFKKINQKGGVYKIGERIVVDRERRTEKKGTIISINDSDNSYNIIFDDGIKQTLTGFWLFPLNEFVPIDKLPTEAPVPVPKFKVGDIVRVLAEYGKYGKIEGNYIGRLTEITSVTMSFDQKEYWYGIPLIPKGDQKYNSVNSTLIEEFKLELVCRN
jgi:hypothetical protein